MQDPLTWFRYRKSMVHVHLRSNYKKNYEFLKKMQQALKGHDHYFGQKLFFRI